MAGREVPPPPDHQDKPVAEDSAASVGERITGTSDARDPDGLITLDDVDKVKGVQDAGGDSTAGSVSSAGDAPSTDLRERVIGGDAPSMNSSGGGNETPTVDGTTRETPWAKQQGIGTDGP